MPGSLLETLLSPVEGDEVAGPNLEYDPDFLELERTAAPKAERSMGDSVKAGEEPDWERVSSLGVGLIGRSKDLRVALHLVNAWLALEGLAGFADGLALIRGLLEQFWPVVHPQLDAEDDNDPTFRVNSVAPLNSVEGTLRYLRNTTFVRSPRMGRFSLRDLRIASGNLKPAVADEGTQPPGLADIEACCMDCPIEQLEANVGALEGAFEHASAIDRAFTEQLGASGPDLKALLGDIQELRKFMQAQLARRSPAAGGEPEEGNAESNAQASPQWASARSAQGSISSIEDVVRSLDEICVYYANAEPSSPVPLLLQRAKRLVGKSFLELLADLAPGGTDQMNMIVGSGSGDLAG